MLVPDQQKDLECKNMLRMFLLVSNRKSKHPLRGCLPLKVVSVATLSAKDGVATLTISCRAATSEIDPYELSVARTARTDKMQGKAGEPSPTPTPH